MGKKLGLTSFFDRMAGTKPFPSSPSSWPWPSCKHPKTHSFRKEDLKGRRNGMNSSYCELSDSCFTSSSAAASGSYSTVDSEASAGDAAEAVIRGLRSDDRLFFEPVGSTSSIVEEAGSVPFEGSIAMAVDSVEPYVDFKVSMEEMIMAHGVRDWEWLQEMLVWYLRMNGKRTHGVIVGAFVDLLLSIIASSSSSSSHPSRSSFTFEIEDEMNHVN